MEWRHYHTSYSTSSNTDWGTPIGVVFSVVCTFLLLLILLANLIPFLSNALWLNFSVAQSHMFRNRLFLLCVLQFLKLAELYPHFSSLMVNAFWLWGSYFSPEALHEPRVASWASDSIHLSRSRSTNRSPCRDHSNIRLTAIYGCSKMWITYEYLN